MGFEMAMSSPVAIYHPSREHRSAVKGDDDVFSGLGDDRELGLQGRLRHCDITNRGRWGRGAKEVGPRFCRCIDPEARVKAQRRGFI